MATWMQAWCTRCMLAGKMDAALRRDDLLVKVGLLLRIKEGEGTARELIVVPHPLGADLELVPYLWMDLGDVFRSLLDAVVMK
jgi:hypothetical protein